MNYQTLWSDIEARLHSGRPDWRQRVDDLRQLDAVRDRDAGRTWRDEEVFKELLMAVLSSNTEWSKIERIQVELEGLFCGFSLEAHAGRSREEISNRLVPWFKERKAGSVALKRNLVYLINAARKLLNYSRTHGAADGFFTSLVRRCDDDPKQAALCLGRPGEYKLPSLGPALAAEALKNLGFDVAKPDRHIMRAAGAFGLVHFERWRDRRGTRAPASTSRSLLLQVMTEVERIAEAAEERVALVDNAIWLLCEKSGAQNGLYLTNNQLADLARRHR